MSYWYVTRATGAVSLLLLTLAVALGVADVTRAVSPRWPRFLTDGLHRNVSLLAVAFVAVHVLTTVLDGFAHIPLPAAFIPFTSDYRPLWLSLGAIAFDMLLALVISSGLRRRIGHRTWRALHWLAYACWPIALVHGLGTGTDTGAAWMLALTAGCLALVLLSLGVRVARGWPEHAQRRGAALGAAGAYVVMLAVWLPSGPLGAHWARRAGTPTPLLGGASTNSAATRERP